MAARATILASGTGTNARNVLEGVRAGRLPLEIAAVVCDRAGAGVLSIARAFGVPGIEVVWDRTRESRAGFDARVIEAVAATQPDLVLMLGWMHLVPAAFLARFPQTINVHPAFLPLDPGADHDVAPDGTSVPALRGAHALRDALRTGALWAGATVHYVTNQTDRGEVLARIPVPVDGAATEEALREKVRAAEFAAVDEAIQKWCAVRAKG